MEILVAVLAFVVVAAAVFAAFSLLDQRNSRARLLRDRLAAVQKSAEREPDEELESRRRDRVSGSREHPEHDGEPDRARDRDDAHHDRRLSDTEPRRRGGDERVQSTPAPTERLTR